MAKIVTLGFLVSVETETPITSELVEDVLQSGFDDRFDLKVHKIDVGPLGEIDVYPEEKHDSE